MAAYRLGIAQQRLWFGVLLLLAGCGGGGGGGGGGTANTPPVANAGQNRNALLNALVLLDGSASSDADAQGLSYQWAITAKPPASAATLSTPASAGTTFTGDVVGTYIAQLVVNDGKDSSAPASVTISVLSSASKVRDTGLRDCYDDSSVVICPTSGTAFYGQDAQYSTNPLVFAAANPVEVVISDSIAGLMWRAGDSGARYNWFQAMGIFDAASNPSTVNVCGGAYGGFADWRLPSRRELVSILDYAQASFGPSGAPITNYFTNSGTQYWTSTTTVVSPDVAWGSDGGRILYGFGSKTSGLYVRCVRGPVWGQNNFVDNADGTVTDLATNLRWQQTDDGVVRNWQAALAYCEGLTLAGIADWRLPDIKELETLVPISGTDITPQLPSIDTASFPGTKSEDYWSSTTRSTTRAWSLDFAFGWVDSDVPKTDFKLTRCVS